MSYPRLWRIAAGLVGAVLMVGCQTTKPKTQPPHALSEKTARVCSQCGSQLAAHHHQHHPAHPPTTPLMVEEAPATGSPTFLPATYPAPTSSGEKTGCNCQQDPSQPPTMVSQGESMEGGLVSRLQPIPIVGESGETVVSGPILMTQETQSPEPELHSPTNVQPVTYQETRPVFIPVPSQGPQPSPIILSEKTSVKYLPTPEPKVERAESNLASWSDSGSQRTFSHSDDYRVLTGEVQQWRNGWRLRYAGVHEEDRYGGSVTLNGDGQLNQLKDGQIVRVRGYLAAGEGRQSSPTFHVQSLQVLGQ